MNKKRLIIINLIKKINYLNYNYYILNKSIVTDIKYDYLINKLRILEKKYNINYNNSPTKKIYNFFSKKLSKSLHISQMLSIKNTYSIKNISFLNKNKFKINNIKYCCEIKLDGIALNLIYKNGILFKILTRGNGIYGEDVTKNLIYIKNIPKKIILNKCKNNINNLLEIRGELCITYKNFLKINNILKVKNYNTFSNQRNASSGIIRNLKFNKIYEKSLNFISYGIGYPYLFNFKKNNINSHFKLLEKINKYGFETDKNTKTCKNIQEITDYYKNIKKIKNNFKYSIDGIVIKLDSINLQNKLGNTKKYPNWLVALKFNLEFKITEILDIKYNVCRTGNITPVLIIKSINISGILIKRIYLYNFKEIILSNIMINDKIIIKLSGSIIPKIEKVLLNFRDYNIVKKIIIPKLCPSCNNIIKINNYKLKCEFGFFCKSQIKYKITHFFSSEAIYIKNINKNFINKLIKNNLINSPFDIFKLNKNDLEHININKYKTFEILNFFNNKINVNLSNFLYGLSIENIGRETSIILENNMNIEDFLNININILKNIKNLNKNKIQNIYNFFTNKKNINLVKNLLQFININNY